MKTQPVLLLILVLFGVGAARATDDAFASVRSALAQNQLETAETALAPLAALDQPDPRAWFYLSQIRARQQKTKEAIALAEKAIAANPGVAEFHSNLGRVIGQRMGEVNFMQQALLAGRMLDAFKQSVALDPDHIAGYIGLARYYTHAPSIAGGGRETAERYAREVEKRDARLGTLEFASIAEHFDDPERAYALYTQAAHTEPRAAWIQHALGRLSETLGRPEAARRHFDQAIALAPSRDADKGARE